MPGILIQPNVDETCMHSPKMCIVIRLIPVQEFCQVKKIKKSEKNSDVGGWVNPQLGFLFSGDFLLLSCFHAYKCF